MPGCEFSHPLAHMPYDSLFNYTVAHCFFHRIPASLCAWDARCRFREKLFNFLFSPRCSSWHYSGCTMREGLRMLLWFSFDFLLIFTTAQGPRVSWAPFEVVLSDPGCCPDPIHKPWQCKNIEDVLWTNSLTKCFWFCYLHYSSHSRCPI